MSERDSVVLSQHREVLMKPHLVSDAGETPRVPTRTLEEQEEQDAGGFAFPPEVIDLRGSVGALPRLAGEAAVIEGLAVDLSAPAAGDAGGDDGASGGGDAAAEAGGAGGDSGADDADGADGADGEGEGEGAANGVAEAGDGDEQEAGEEDTEEGKKKPDLKVEAPPEDISEIRHEKMFGYAPRDLRRAFRLIDTRHDNFVDVDEISAAFQKLGMKIGRDRVRDMVWEVDEDMDGGLVFNEFKAMYARVLRDASGCEPRGLFSLIDFLVLDRDCGGTLSRARYSGVMYDRFGKDQYEQTAPEASPSADHDDDLLGFADFVALQRKLKVLSTQYTAQRVRERRANEEKFIESISPKNKLPPTSRAASRAGRRGGGGKAKGRSRSPTRRRRSDKRRSKTPVGFEDSVTSPDSLPRIV